MLYINSTYTPIRCILNESVASDSFEKMCYDYLKSNYPNRKFELRGSNNNTVADILVDDSFYIECKMSDTTLGNGAQSTGFGLVLTEDLYGNERFECSKQNYVKSKAVDEILNYINNNIDDFIALTEQNSGSINIELDKSVFAKYISEFYNDKNVKFFMTSKNGEFSIFKNSPRKIAQYFDISACVRYFGYGTKSIPKSKREEVINYLNSVYKVKSVRYEGSKTFVTLKKPLQSRYITFNDLNLFMSSAGCDKSEYRIRKLTGRGGARVMFKLRTIRNQLASDIEAFENSYR